MRDLSPPTGRAFPANAKRPGKTRTATGRNGAAQPGPAGLKGPAHRDGAAAPIVVPASDFEGFGSFSG